MSDTAETWMNRAEPLSPPPNLAAALSAEQRFEREALPHLHDLVRTASRMMGDRGRAEDVVQDVFLQAWKSFGRFETGTNCRAWLYKILFHCVQHYRRKWFRFSVMQPMDEYTESTAAYTPPIPEHLTDEDLLAALEQIPADFRAVLLLVDVEEFAYREAAEILQVPIGTVMSRVSRGRRLLRDAVIGKAVAR